LATIANTESVCSKQQEIASLAAGVETPWPRITVVVPSRDRPLLLRRALWSILTQRYEGEIECVVSFDGSDGSLPALPLPPRRTLRAVRNDRTPGASGARNTGAIAATGSLLAFCDDDDEWLPDKLRDQVIALRNAPQPSAAGCGIYISYREKTAVRIPKNEGITFEDLLRSRYPELGPSTILVRRDDFFGRIGPYDESVPGSYAEDYDWLLRAARLGPIAIVRKPLARIYWHEASLFGGRWNMVIDALQYIIDKHANLRRDRRGLGRIYGQIAVAHGAAQRPSDARKWAWRTLLLDWRQPRAYLALLIWAGLSPQLLLHTLRRFGRGL
jgi:glycosyltransferase involved in cell wall biosynthesis